MANGCYLAMTAAEFQNCSSIPAHPAWMSCHFSPDGPGLTDLPDELPEGAILILDDSIPCHGHSADTVSSVLSQLAARSNCSGLILDFQRSGSNDAAAIAAALAHTLPCTAAVTPEYAKGLPCPVFLPPAPLHMPLVKYLQPWRNREIWLEAALCKETASVGRDKTVFTVDNSFSVPDKGFIHERLCCKYVTEIQEDRILFRLFDTEETLMRKLELAQALGVHRAVGLYQELGAFLTG